MTTTREHNAALETLDERYAALRLIQPKQFAWLHESVARHGLLYPVTVNGTEDGKLVVLDGFKRLLVLREREESEVWVRVVHLSAPEAQAAIVMNLSEGRKRVGRDRLHLWRIADGSAEE